MKGEIIAIGDELTSGRIFNTTSFFAAGKLFAVGHEIISMATVGDSPPDIEDALKKALGRADFIIVTGGLGPTTDDLTNETVSQVLDRPVTLYPEILAMIGAERDGALDTSDHPLKKLAWLPAGAEVLNPTARMAGYLLVHGNTPIFFLPGVPFEMKQLLIENVIPWLSAWEGEGTRVVRQRLFKLFGLSEFEINKRLTHIEGKNPNIRIGYYPVFPEVHVNLTVSGRLREEVEHLLFEIAYEIEKEFFQCIFAQDNETMEGQLGHLLRSQGKTLAVAESCTGGLIARKITSVPGSSEYFIGGVVAYSNDLKERILSVPRQILDQVGAVSAETARAMAEGVAHLGHADLGVSVTGIAGPAGGSSTKPVGTVFIGLTDEKKTAVHCFQFAGERWQIQELSCQTAMDIIRRSLLNRD